MPQTRTVPLVPRLTKSSSSGGKAGAGSNLLQRIQEVTAHLRKAWESPDGSWSKVSSLVDTVCKAANAEDMPFNQDILEQVAAIRIACQRLALATARDNAASNAGGAWHE